MRALRNLVPNMALIVGHLVKWVTPIEDTRILLDSVNETDFEVVVGGARILSHSCIGLFVVSIARSGSIFAVLRHVAEHDGLGVDNDFLSRVARQRLHFRCCRLHLAPEVATTEAADESAKLSLKLG